MNKPFEVFAETTFARRRINIHFVQRMDGGRIATLKAATVEVREESEAITEPALSITNDEAQQLMDELWRCGLRPTEGTGSAGSLAATERHLSDMRNITTGLLKKVGVELP